ncbi:MAG: phosphate acyltransferase [Desulfomonilaceae bacterium]
MREDKNISKSIKELQRAIAESGYFPAELFGDLPDHPSEATPGVHQIQRALRDAENAQHELEKISEFLHERVIAEILRLDRRIRDPEHFSELRGLLGGLLSATDDFRHERQLAKAYGELLSVYALILYRCGSPGRESPIVQMILSNVARRKAPELGQAQLQNSLNRLERTITIALIAKRYAVYVLAVHGFQVLFRSEIDFRTFGTSPEELALQITNLLLKNSIKLSQVTDVVCGGGDLGTVPDGIYVLTEKVRDESWKRLHNSSLNRGALVAWELRNLLRLQGDRDVVNASLCSPLSFSTLSPHDVRTMFRAESRELRQSLKGFVKVTPLKSVAALLSEIHRINPDNMNLLVMALDELFASVARKTGPNIIREITAQEANRILIEFDFDKIVECLKQENFTIPQHFRLAAREIGTGVKEICELLMIVESGKISPSLARSLMHVVDSYARQVAMVLEMASAGKPSQRPHFIVITSMMALDRHFHQLFGRIRDMLDKPFTPVMCLDSLEHEYLIANHLFEMYVNPAKRDRRLHYTVEAKSVQKALQVLGAAGGGVETFSFSSLLDEVTGYISERKFRPADLVLVGADNGDALVAVSNARDYGLIDRVALVGNPPEILDAIERAKVPMSPNLDPKVEIVSIDPLAVDFDSKKKSMAETFSAFLKENPGFLVMKGSVDTAGLLREALSIYKTGTDSGDGSPPPPRRLASNTALFVLPDGRFLALSDAAVNPGFRSAEALLQVIENQLDVVRKVVDTRYTLKVALITAVEKETAASPATILAAEAEEKAKALEARYGPLVVEGPLSFDLATVPEVAEEKHYQGRIMGDANCLVATDINTANVLYKMLSKTMGSLGLLVDNGAIITAGPGTVPIVLTSRGDTAQTKFNSILLALAYSAGGQEQKQATAASDRPAAG